MDINVLPEYDMNDNPTNCCPRFKPDPWNEKELHFKVKLFIKASTRSFFHLPLNIGLIFRRVFKAIEDADAQDMRQFIVLSRDVSAWRGEHFFSVTKDVPGQAMVRITGDFQTMVFEGPYRNIPKWEQQMRDCVEGRGKELEQTYFFYTTCPKCAKFYGKNYVVAVSKFR